MWLLLVRSWGEIPCLFVCRFRRLSGGRDHGKQFAQPRCHQALAACSCADGRSDDSLGIVVREPWRRSIRAVFIMVRPLRHDPHPFTLLAFTYSYTEGSSLHCFYRKSLLIKGFRCFSNDDGLYGRILCIDITKLSGRRSGCNLFASVSRTQKRGKHLKPCDFTWFYISSVLQGFSLFQETVMGCMVVFCALASYTSKFSDAIRGWLCLFLCLQRKERSNVWNSVIVDASMKILFLRVLGVSETTTTCMVHFCALTHGIKFGIKIADAICLCLLLNTEREANTQNPVTVDDSISNLFFRVLGVSETRRWRVWSVFLCVDIIHFQKLSKHWKQFADVFCLCLFVLHTKWEASA